jgi:hypothetical protein
VRAGSRFKDKGGHLHEVRQIILHPDFNEDDLDSDIALLKVCISSQVCMNFSKKMVDGRNIGVLC